MEAFYAYVKKLMVQFVIDYDLSFEASAFVLDAR